MRYAKIDECECTNGKGWGVSLYVQGCPIRCKGCFNPETGDFSGGLEYTEKTELQIFDLLKDKNKDRLSILGGEPLYKDNLFELVLLCNNIKEYLDVDIGLGTGYTGEQLQERLKENKDKGPQLSEEMYLKPLLELVDYIICGPFVEQERDLTLFGRGSRNQEIILCSQSIKKEEKILYKK